MAKNILNEIVKEIHRLKSLDVDLLYDFSSLLDRTGLFFQDQMGPNSFDDINIERILENMAEVSQAQQTNNNFSSLMEGIPVTKVPSIDYI